MANFREFLGKNTIFNEHLLHAGQLWVLLALTLRHFPVEWLLSVQGDHPNIQAQRKKNNFQISRHLRGLCLRMFCGHWVSAASSLGPSSVTLQFSGSYSVIELELTSHIQQPGSSLDHTLPWINLSYSLKSFTYLSALLCYFSSP